MKYFSDNRVVKHERSALTVLDEIALKRLACSCFAGMSIVDRETPRVRSERRNNVLAMRPVSVCTLCGLGRNIPHKTHSECLRALDAEIRACISRGRALTKKRFSIFSESMEKYEKFLDRRRS